MTTFDWIILATVVALEGLGLALLLPGKVLSQPLAQGLGLLQPSAKTCAAAGTAVA